MEASSLCITSYDGNHYAQTEKEATWACKKFSGYILRRRMQVEIDHKAFLGTKHLDGLATSTQWIQLFSLTCSWYYYYIKF